MSKLDDYHRWMEARARYAWLRAMKVADDHETGKIPADEATIKLTRQFADSAYDTYCIIGLDNPDNYRAHKRIKKLRKARGSNL